MGDRTGRDEPQSRRGPLKGRVVGSTEQDHAQMLVRAARCPCFLLVVTGPCRPWRALSSKMCTVIIFSN
jgi:hypothetical protein